MAIPLASRLQNLFPSQVYSLFNDEFKALLLDFLTKNHVFKDNVENKKFIDFWITKLDMSLAENRYHEDSTSYYFDISFSFDNINDNFFYYTINITNLLNLLSEKENIELDTISYADITAASEYTIATLDTKIKVYQYGWFRVLTPLIFFETGMSKKGKKSFTLVDGNHRLKTKRYQRSTSIPILKLSIEEIVNFSNEIFPNNFDLLFFQLAIQLQALCYLAETDPTLNYRQLFAQSASFAHL